MNIHIKFYMCAQIKENLCTVRRTCNIIFTHTLIIRDHYKVYYIYLNLNKKRDEIVLF